MRQRREDFRNIALIVGSGCLGALAIGIGWATATTPDVAELRFGDRHMEAEFRVGHIEGLEGRVEGLEDHSLIIAGAARKNRTVSLEIRGTADASDSRESNSLESNHDFDFIVVSGVAGSRPTVRYQNAEEAGAPIVYVDGVRFDSGMEGLRQVDIENVEMKGSAAKEQYGEEGKNGVIVVTTKTGKKRKGGGKH